MIPLLVVPPLSGCLGTADLPTEAPVRRSVVRDTGAKYYFYVPSSYTARRRWPLVILCHGTKPFDSAWLQIKEWAKFAQEHRLIVAAPELVGVRGDFPPSVDTQVARQRVDERTILGTVAAVKAAYNIAQERVFLCGWSGGAYAVFYTGLRNPDVFRALSSRHGNFDARFLEEATHRLDRWQPVFICYGMSSPLRKQSEAAVAWLSDMGMSVDETRFPGWRPRIDAGVVWDFFKKVYQRRAWIRVHAVVSDYRRPRDVRFWVRAVPAALGVHWRFGDGSEIDALTAVHAYEKDGTYDVTADVTLQGGKRFHRTLTVQVPQGGSGVAAPANE